MKTIVLKSGFTACLLLSSTCDFSISVEGTYVFVCYSVPVAATLLAMSTKNNDSFQEAYCAKKGPRVASVVTQGRIVNGWIDEFSCAGFSCFH